MSPVIVFITVFLVLATLGLFLIYFEERKQGKPERARMRAIAAETPYKPIHIEV